MPEVTIRYYPGPTYVEALRVYEEDLQVAAASGWFPVATVWGWDPKLSAGVLISGSHWTPGDGVLAVTYRRDAGTQASSE